MYFRVLQTRDHSCSNPTRTIIKRNRQHKDQRCVPMMMNGGATAAPYGARNGRAAPIRLKAIVLGSAGAGKTSILRRYFNNVSSPPRKEDGAVKFASAFCSWLLFENLINNLSLHCFCEFCLFMHHARLEKPCFHLLSFILCVHIRSFVKFASFSAVEDL